MFETSVAAINAYFKLNLDFVSAGYSMNLDFLQWSLQQHLIVSFNSFLSMSCSFSCFVR